MKSKLLYSVLLAVLPLSLVLASCGSSSTYTGDSGNASATGTTEGASTATEITMKNIHFVPNDITVAVGTTVTWTNEDAVAHNVTSDDGLFESGNITKGETFSYTFDKPGTYSYHCTLHPPDMKGTVVVQ